MEIKNKGPDRAPDPDRDQRIGVTGITGEKRGRV